MDSSPLATATSEKPRVGLAGSRVEYEFHEHAFTATDMKPDAVAARQSVQQSLASTILSSSKPHWNASTVPQLTEYEAAYQFDNKYFAAVQTRHLIDRARHRLDCIRQGVDPDNDPRSIQPRWNVSSKLEDDEGHLHLPDKLARFTHRNPVLSDYKTPIEKERLFEELKRTEKERVMAEQEQRLRRLRNQFEWERKEAWNGPLDPVTGSATGTSGSSSGDDSAEANELRRPVKPHMSMQDYNTTNQPHTHVSSYTSSDARVKRRSPRLMQTPFTRSSHTGHFGWIEYSTGQLVKQWSCCRSRVETQTGCKTMAEVSNQARLVTSHSSGTGSKSIVVRYNHTGQYGPTRVDGILQWSCCSAESVGALGCVKVKVVDESRWNIEKATL